MRTLEFRAMGSHMLAVLDRDDEAADAQLAAVPAWFEEWEQQMSRFRPDSDLIRLNAAGHAEQVPDALLKVVRVALQAARESAGLVRPTVLDALAAAGYDRSFDQLPADGASVAALPAPDWRGVALDLPARTITLPPGVHLDLGGVAKGWAADQAARRLSAAGPALIDAGGDIAVSGPMANGAAWPIAIANPLAPDDTLGNLLLARGAVATSGRDFRRWQRGGAEQHHIIDPRTGRPARTDVLTATVIAPDGPSAEVAAKVALMLGSGAGLAWLEARPTLAGLLVLDDGTPVRSRRMDVYLEMNS
jgi:thiamine biosynthesis lipoprotein